jgi:hypothetical protein
MRFESRGEQWKEKRKDERITISTTLKGDSSAVVAYLQIYRDQRNPESPHQASNGDAMDDRVLGFH